MAKTATLTPQASAKKASDGDAGVGGYVQSVIAEARKISWPTPQQVLANTVIVVVLTTVFSTLLWLVDTIFRASIVFLTQTLPNIVA